MSEDEAVENLKRQWGLTAVWVRVPMVPLIKFVGRSFKSLGMAQAVALMAQEQGAELRKELDRMERLMTCDAEDVFR